MSSQGEQPQMVIRARQEGKASPPTALARQERSPERPPRLTNYPGPMCHSLGKYLSR